MKNRQHILPCGRVIFFKEVNPRDVARYKRVQRMMLDNAKELDKFSSYNTAGRKRSVWYKNTYNKFVTLLTTKLVDHLMEGDRIETKPGRLWAIAGVNADNPKFTNFHTDGMTYATTVIGMNGNYRILLSQKRRKELRNRIDNGQQFHTV
jgi:hypothetical protein